MATMESLSDADLLTALREINNRTAEDDDWFDHGGEIAAAWEEAVLEECEKRGFTGWKITGEE